MVLWAEVGQGVRLALGCCGWWIKGELRFSLLVFFIWFTALACLSLGKYCMLLRCEFLTLREAMQCDLVH